MPVQAIYVAELLYVKSRKFHTLLAFTTYLLMTLPFYQTVLQKL